MEKSLLTILEAERAAVNDYIFAKEYEAEYKAKAETAEDAIEKEVMLEFVAEYTERREKAEARITEARKEIKKYLNHIM